MEKIKQLIAALLFAAAIAPAYGAVTTTIAANPAAGCAAGQACSGTVITATTQFAAPAGTVNVPAITLAGDASGWYRNASNQWTWTNSTAAYLSIFQSGTTQLRLHPSMWLSWTATDSTTAQDLVLSRSAAGLLLISGDGTGTASGQTGWKIGNLSADPTYSLLTGSQAASLSRANSVLNTNGTTTSLNAPNNGSGLFFTIHDITKGRFTVAAGSGLEITAGTTADNTNRALTITQTWTNGTSSNKAIFANITVGTGTGNLLELQAGGAAKFYVTEAGNTTTAGNMIAAGALQSQYWNSSDNSFTGMQIITATGNVQVYQQLIPKSYAVASLPTGVTGGIVQVSDASACPAKGSAVSAGGSAKCIVYYNGSAWVGI